MKTLLSIIILCILALSAIAQDKSLTLPSSANTDSSAQDRYISPRRQPLLPQLLENPDSHIASGLAQSPYGYPINISVEPLPRGSIVGLYGILLKRNGVREVLIMNGSKEYSLRVAVNPQLFPKLEMMTFRLPPEITGEVLVSAIGLTYSNWVRFIVE